LSAVGLADSNFKFQVSSFEMKTIHAIIIYPRHFRPIRFNHLLDEQVENRRAGPEAEDHQPGGKPASIGFVPLYPLNLDLHPAVTWDA